MNGILDCVLQLMVRRAGLLDMAVFAYIWTVLDKLGESNLASIIKKYPNLVKHADYIKQLAYPS